MRVALLSCGPSVRLYEKCGHEYDAIIGINNIVAKYETDWWCFGDAETFARYVPVKRPQSLCTDKDQVFSILHNYPVEIQQRYRAHPCEVCWEDLENPGSKPFLFSSCAALMLAKYLGAKTLDIFGVDMEGNADFEGREHLARTESRWERERQRWNESIKWLEGTGVRYAIFSERE